MKNFKSQKLNAGSIALFAAAVFVFLVGVASLVYNILYYNRLVDNYVSQGYPSAEVASELMQQMLLPGLFQSIGLYIGLAFAIFGIGMIYYKASAKSAIFEGSKAAFVEDMPERSIGAYTEEIPAKAEYVPSESVPTVAEEVGEEKAE